MTTSEPGAPDLTATAILKEYHPAMLHEYQPLSILGDGNCLYRAISRALYGTERYHNHIRLLTACEIAKHREYYDTSAADYVDLIKDPSIVCDKYIDLIKAASRDGEWGEMMHMYAASAALS